MERGWPSGPRLPRHRPVDPTDPANGGCFNCGDKVPAPSRYVLMTEGGKRAGRWHLCDPCFEWGNPPDPQAGDPLDVTEAA
jgi:hypothetical protein